MMNYSFKRHDMFQPSKRCCRRIPTVKKLPIVKVIILGTLQRYAKGWIERSQAHVDSSPQISFYFILQKPLSVKPCPLAINHSFRYRLKLMSVLPLF